MNFADYNGYIVKRCIEIFKYVSGVLKYEK